jgi:hypothetical protein
MFCGVPEVTWTWLAFFGGTIVFSPQLLAFNNIT